MLIPIHLIHKTLDYTLSGTVTARTPVILDNCKRAYAQWSPELSRVPAQLQAVIADKISLAEDRVREAGYNVL